ncbi:MAG: ATP-dependent DNA helicase RecQ [Elusimicrobia bacterium RIFCSPLOWO2_02_FULL_39_32]|nr:MAG: ATP-dependent DNA helicase RecQ [Elusimicrobia bacterium RIFCSPHIGHO2_02_FULL_39_36]OGR93662.1 MAG: ATP-dependent DNA helicase RecQ [Elusimicrobia bacterium RIFCSPLOWO2_02_FULL_39_32]OGS00483.1 MAG: ATP-dependent DNA helicase RecQ [Elusimicrobia bacterium RIFCSPLOWO2_12_FULL_39_28]
MKNQILETLTKYWGYTSFRLFQEEAILSILEDRDTLTVLPTGGGKSVCFQLPALISDGTAVIISPLISLMKDQVDYLKDLGIDAECLNSSLSSSDQFTVIEKIRAGGLKLLYLSPERLMFEQTTELLKSVKLSFFVIDEAHCISHWGHNFREEYRQLGFIKKEFKNIGVHAFTATATLEVQQDIVKQLNLDAPHLYIGNIDRPNLNYRILPRSSHLLGQIVEVIKKHPNDPGIIYCLRRADVDELSKKLNDIGYQNLPYHAGLSDEERKKNQDEFSSERINIIVATIAFGMGVDCSNIRYVIHSAMPKSIEHYQQETGRAGRDGLSADCTLFYSGGDYRTWETMLRDSSDKEMLLSKLKAMYNFCVRPECRHRTLVNYFSHTYENNNCGACDVCLGEVEMVQEPLVIGQKIISCVARVQQRFGADHISDILKGNRTASIERWGHEKLSTFSLMNSETKVFIRFMIEQLLGQGFLRREGEYLTIAITGLGQNLLKGEAVPVLAKPIVAVKKKEIEIKRRSKRTQEWEGLDEKLFNALRAKRAELAQSKSVPAYIIFSDKTLKDMTLTSPKTIEQFANVFGVGATKQKQYGQIFIDVIKKYEGTNGQG